MKIKLKKLAVVGISAVMLVLPLSAMAVEPEPVDSYAEAAIEENTVENDIGEAYSDIDEYIPEIAEDSDIWEIVDNYDLYVTEQDEYNAEQDDTDEADKVIDTAEPDVFEAADTSEHEPPIETFRPGILDINTDIDTDTNTNADTDTGSDEDLFNFTIWDFTDSLDSIESSITVTLNAVESGTVNNVTWYLYDDGTLYVEGTGDISQLTIESGSEYYLRSGSSSTGISANEVKSVNIADTITGIGSCGFYLCKNLTSITIPDSVTSIGNDAFAYCVNLTSVTIPDSITTISNTTFYYCSSLKSVTIPESVTSIGNYAFTYCSSLTGITIPNSVTSVGTQAFENCPKLTDIQIDHAEGVLANAPWNATTATLTYLRDISIPTISSQTYTGSYIKPVSTIYEVRKNDTSIKSVLSSSLYTVTYSNNVSVGTAAAVIKLNAQSVDYATKTFTISAAAISSATIGSVSSQTYTGSGITPAPTLTYNSKTLTKDTDYTLSYSNNTNAGTATITITGKGNFTGTATKAFTISARAISSATIGSVSSQTYTGSGITPAPTLTYNSKTLTKDTDYTLSYSNNTNAGTATITITGKGNFTGTTTKTFTIAAKAISGVTISNVSSQTYTGSGITPTPTLTYNSKTLTKDTDYTLSYSNNTNAGTATITITGKGNFTGTTTKTFTIAAKAISGVTIGSVSSQTYNGNAYVPEPTITYNGKTLIKNTDYALSYWDNIDAGTATIVIEGMGNFKDATTKSFVIKAQNLSNVNIVNAKNQTYDIGGASQTPEPTLTYNGVTLIRDADYTLSYKDNINPGTATITITGINNFTGTTTSTFTINQISIPDAAISNISPQTYTGSAITPKPVLTYNGVTLMQDEHYTLSYDKNTNAGTATITIIGIGVFTDSNSTTFNILAKSIDGEAVVADIPDTEYNKEDICPEPEIKVGDTVLVKDADYTLTYENNRNAGMATVTAVGIGNYSGSADKTFEITPRDGDRYTVVVWEIYTLFGTSNNKYFL